MSLFRLTCEGTTDLLSDYLDGNLSLWQNLRVRFHLLFCPACTAMLATLASLSRLAEDLEDPAASAQAAALERALARLSQVREPRPWPATPVPAEAQALLDTQPDLPLSILAATHRTVAAAREPEPGPYHLPQGILAKLPPENQWHWIEGVKGRRRVELLRDPVHGQRLILAYAPGGVRSRPHRHLGSESILVLKGTMVDRDQDLTPGDWVHHPEGSVHAPEIRDEACWCLIREEGDTAAATTLERLRLKL